MKMSTRGQYGTRALLELAIHYGKGPILIRDIAKRQEISKHYLEQLFIQLTSAGLVNSTRGSKGGFTLAKPPEQIRISEVIQLFEGSLAPVQCVDDPELCSRANLCATRDLWGKMERAMAGVLEATTLQDLLEQQRKKEQTDVAMYHI